MTKGRALSGHSHRAWIGCAALVFAVMATQATHARASDTYALSRIGLTDALHTAANGVQSSQIWLIDDAGRAYGSSDIMRLGHGWSTIWAFDPSSDATIPISPVDAEHTGSNGQRAANFTTANGLGLAGGTATRWQSGTFAGTSAWIYDLQTGTSRVVGLLDADHTAADGRRDDHVAFIGDSGIVLGASCRYADNSFETSAFAHDFSTNVTRRIGLSIADGVGSDAAWIANNNGLIGGINISQIGSAEVVHAWVYDWTTQQTQKLGYYDADHTSSTGAQSSQVFAIGDNGLAVGTSTRYVGSSIGASAWLYDSPLGPAQRLGFTGAAYTSPQGLQDSRLQFLTAGGIVAGTSNRFFDLNGVSLSSAGMTAWLYDKNLNTYTTAGLHDSVASGDRSANRFIRPTANGAWVGVKIDASSSASEAIWRFDPATDVTQRIDAVASTDPHINLAFPRFVDDNTLGQIIGVSNRYRSTGGYAGSAGWFYDPSTDTTTNLEFGGDVGGNVRVRLVGLDNFGDVFGSYARYEPDAGASVDVAFRWSVTGGLQDLETVVQGGLPVGWNRLVDTLGPSGNLLFGDAYINVSSDAAYVLTPIPEPTPSFLIALVATLIGSAAVRGRQRRIV